MPSKLIENISFTIVHFHNDVDWSEIIPEGGKGIILWGVEEGEVNIELLSNVAFKTCIHIFGRKISSKLMSFEGGGAYIYFVPFIHTFHFNSLR